MVAVNVAIPAGELIKRMKDRLRMPAAGAVNTVVWQRGSDRAILLIDSLKTKFLDGWLLCSLDLQSDGTGRRTLQFVFYLGTEQDAGSLHGACAMNLATPQAAQLADVWGADLRRVLWDAVLDAIEAAVQLTSDKKRGLALTLEGFGCTPKRLQVSILAGA